LSWALDDISSFTGKGACNNPGCSISISRWAKRPTGKVDESDFYSESVLSGKGANIVEGPRQEMTRRRDEVARNGVGSDDNTAASLTIGGDRESVWP
jgi:hypothetical protein